MIKPRQVFQEGLSFKVFSRERKMIVTLGNKKPECRFVQIVVIQRRPYRPQVPFDLV